MSIVKTPCQANDELTCLQIEVNKHTKTGYTAVCNFTVSQLETALAEFTINNIFLVHVYENQREYIISSTSPRIVNTHRISCSLNAVFVKLAHVNKKPTPSLIF